VHECYILRLAVWSGEQSNDLATFNEQSSLALDSRRGWMRLLVYSLLTAALVFVANAIDSSEDDGAAHARATSRTATNIVIDSTNRNLVLGTPTGGGKYPFLAIVQWNDVAIDPRVSDYLVRSSERPTIEEPVYAS
jgi:hypothetical protein